MKLQHVDLHNTITSLSCALDLVGVDEVRHGKRVAVMARAIAENLGWPGAECLSILYAGMLHDCGVSRIHEHQKLTEMLKGRCLGTLHSRCRLFVSLSPAGAFNY